MPNFDSLNLKGANITIFLLFLLIGVCFASGDNTEHKATVSIPNVALLSLQYEGNSNVGLVETSPSTAGSIVDFVGNTKTSVWVNYSSICRKDQKRKITATVVGEIPKGLIVKLRTESSVGGGKGELGESNGIVILSNTPSDVISGIGSCYTGKGINNGHLLSYEFEIDKDQFSQKTEKGITSVSVLYTLTDDN